jgi:hypothetical protein
MTTWVRGSVRQGGWLAYACLRHPPTGRSKAGRRDGMARSRQGVVSGSGTAAMPRASVRARGGDRESGRAGARATAWGDMHEFGEVNSEQCPPMASSGTSRTGQQARQAMGCSRIGGKLRGKRHMAQREGTGLARLGGSSTARRRRARHARARQRGIENAVTTAMSPNN